MSAVVTVTSGAVRQLDRRIESDEVITSEDAVDGTKLARLLTRILGEIAKLRRRFSPRRIDFRDIVSDGLVPTPYVVRLQHGFGGPVVYWPVKHRQLGTVTLALMQEMPESDDNTLILNIYYQGTIDIRVEEAG